jgi:hypothetical protein
MIMKLTIDMIHVPTIAVYLTEIIELGLLATKNAECLWTFRNQWPGVPFSNTTENPSIFGGQMPPKIVGNHRS